MKPRDYYIIIFVRKFSKIYQVFVVVLSLIRTWLVINDRQELAPIQSLSHRRASQSWVALDLLVLAVFDSLDHVPSFRDGLAAEWRLLGILERAHSFPRINMIQNHVRWNRQSVIKESFLDDISLLRILIINFGELLIMQWNLISFDKIVVEMNG